MSRVPGVFPISANYEVNIAEPLDARSRVSLQADLIAGEIPYPYNGMMVTVYGDSDPLKNGTYWLKDASNVTLIASWKKLDAPATTDELEEGIVNFYFTPARARQSISAVGDFLQYNNTTGVLSTSYTPENAANKGVAGGYVPLNISGKINTSYLPDSVLGNLRYGGTYNGTVIAANMDLFPELNGVDLPSTAGYTGVYFISTANFTRTGVDYVVGDWVVHNGGGVYVKVDNSDAITSFNGRIGPITLVSGDITDALGFSPITNLRTITINGVGYDLTANRAWTLTTADISEGGGFLYYNDTRARAALSFAAGSGAYNSSTGVITIPTDTIHLANSAGYLTFYNETDTLASVTGRGATTSTALTFNGGFTASSGIVTGGFTIQPAGDATLTVRANTSSNTARILFNNGASSIWALFKDSTVADFRLYNYNLAAFAMTVNVATNAFTFGNSITATSIIRSGGTSAQFLKADGSIDTSAYITAAALSGYATESWVNSALTNYYTLTQIQNFFSGSSAITGYNRANWETAYGWGNWAAGSHYIGTTLIANNRGSGAQTLTGVSIDGTSGNANLWNGWNQDYSVALSTAPSGLFGYNSGTATQRIYNATSLGLFLGLGSAAYTASSAYYAAGSTVANSTLLQGYSAVVAANANTVALRDGNGYLRAVYFYDDNVAVAGSGITSMYGGSGDKYLYKFSAAAVQLFLGINTGATFTNSISGSAGSAGQLNLISLGTGSVNVNTSNTVVYRNENGAGAALAYAPVLHVGGGDTQWQMQINHGTGNGTLYFRQGYNGGWGSWLTALSSANYNSYAPGLTGGGASGTWAINITGTAASETLGTVTSRGNSTSGTIYVNGSSADWALRIIASTAAGQSYGIYNRAGTVLGDWNYYFTTQDGNTLLGSLNGIGDWFTKGSATVLSGNIYGQSNSSFIRLDNSVGMRIGYTNSYYQSDSSGLAFIFNGSTVGQFAGGGYFRTVNEIYPGYNNGTSGQQTSYYIAGQTNSAGLSTNGSFTAAEFYNYGYFRNYSAGWGMYNQATTAHFYSSSSVQWDFATSGGSYTQVSLRAGGHGSQPRGYLYADTGNNIGFLAYDGMWGLRIDASKNVFAYSALFPGSNNLVGGANQGDYYFYGNTANQGIRTNGNFLVNGDVYVAASGMGVWLTSWLNQSVKTDASPTFIDVTANGGWHRNNGAYGLYNNTYGGHLYQENANYWALTGNNTTTFGMVFRVNYNSTVKGYLYTDNSGFGLLNNLGNWAVQTNSGGGGVLHGAWTTTGDIRSNGIYRDYQGEALIQTSGDNTIIGTTGAGTVRSMSFYTGNALSMSLYTNQAAVFNGMVTDIGLGRMINPKGGLYQTSASVVTGAIKITQPFMAGAQMSKMTVKIYEYTTGASFTITICGHRDGASWYNVSAYQNGDTVATDINVRFGHDGVNNCVWIGETSRAWSYPQVFVTDIQNGYSSISNIWQGQWNVSFVTSFDTVMATRLAKCNVKSDGSNASGTWGINISGNAAIASQVSINYNNDSGGNYYILWGSGNSIYGTGNIYCNPNTDTIYAAAYRGSANVGGTGEASYHPAGIYSTGTNWLYGTIFMNGNNLSEVNQVNGGTLNMTNTISTSGSQGRFGGWYTGTGFTGAAIEIGYSGGAGNVIAYNRQTGVYSPLYITGGTGSTTTQLLLDTSEARLNNPLRFINYGAGLIGMYDSAKYQAVFSMGDAYKPTLDGTSLSNMYGISWTHSNAGGQSVAGLGHQALFVAAGLTQTAIGDGIWTRNTIHANSVIYTNNWFYNKTANTGMLNEATLVHSYSSAAGQWDFAGSNNSWIQINLRTHGAGTAIRGALYADSTPQIGFLNSSGSWSFRVTNNGDTHSKGAVFPGYDNAAGYNEQVSWYFYGNSANSGIRTNGNLLVNQDIYLGARGQWLYAWLDQDVRTVSAPTFTNVYVSDWFRNNAASTGIYNTTNANHFYSRTSTAWAFTFAGNTSGQIQFRHNHESTIAGYIHYDTTGFGLLGADGNWRVRITTGNYIAISNWIQMDGSHGIFWPSHYGLHLAANTTSTYTSFSMSGDKAGYSGYYLTHSGVNGAMYDSSGNGGIYREANSRWYLYYHVANDCLGIGSSSTSSSYGLYISSKGIYSGAGGNYFGGYITAPAGGGTSDLRVKNVHSIDSKQSVLNLLHLRRYNFLESKTLDTRGDQRIRWGFATDDVRENYPELIFNIGANDKAESLNYTDLHNMAIIELRDTKAEKSELEILREEVNQLRQQLKNTR